MPTETSPKTFAEMLKAELRTTQGKVQPVEEVVTRLRDREPDAQPDFIEMHAMFGGLAAIDSKLPFPVVQVGIGGIAGLLVGELIDGFAMPKQGGKANIANVVGKAAAVIVAAGPGRRWLGNTGALAFGTVLTVQVLADILPVSEWAASLKKNLPGVNKAGLRQPFPVTPPSRDKIAAWF